jgi:hypothetical protein
MAVNSLSGLILMCRRNVLKTIDKQDPELAGKLGLKETISLKPEALSGDKAYGIGGNLEHLDGEKIKGYISVKDKINRCGPDLFTQDDFSYDSIQDTLNYPAGCIASHSKRDVVHTEDQQRKGLIFQFTRQQCGNCELKAICFTGKSKIHGRAVHISYYEPWYRQMKERMESEEGKAMYKNRYRVEHKIADLARYCGMRRCRYRGLARAGIHNLLAAAVSNIKRMARLLCLVEGVVRLKADKPPEISAVAC